MAISPGCVIEVFAAHISPPHRKYYVVCCLEPPPPLGFFINSRISAFIQKRPPLKAAQVALTKTEHPFLTYDSWLDCSEVHTFTREFLEREVRTNPPALLGQLSVGVRTVMLAAIKASHTLPQNHIGRICAAFEATTAQPAEPAEPFDDFV
jgi:hypothetical protein